MLILSAPSGGGKTTISHELLKIDNKLKVSTSVTTRAPRKGEVNGKDYHFVDVEHYKQLRHSNYFLEHAKVFDHYYGTPRDQVEDQLSAGYDILFDIDWQGTVQLTQSARNDVVSIFILPPSLDELRKRLQSRDTDSPEIIADRMRRAKNEINQWYGYDYVLFNYSLDQCLEDVLHILKAERTRRTRQHNLQSIIETMFEESGEDDKKS